MSRNNIRNRSPVWAQELSRKLLTALGEVVLSHPYMADQPPYPQEAVQPVADLIEDLDRVMKKDQPYHYQRDYYFGPGGIAALAAGPESDDRAIAMRERTPPSNWDALQDELEAVAEWMREGEGKYKESSHG